MDDSRPEPIAVEVPLMDCDIIETRHDLDGKVTVETRRVRVPFATDL